MKIIMNVFNFFIDAGPTVMLPVIITIIGLIFGLKISRAFKSGLTLGIGFAGIKLILDFMTTNVGPAAKAMVDRTGVKLDALDVGWGSIAAVTWASPIIPILIVAILLVNIVLLILKRTHTLDVDIWNYHHMAIVGVMVYFVTKNVFLGVGASVVMAIATFKISDWSQPMVESFFGIPGVSLPTVSALSSLVIAWPLNWLLDRIPLFRKSKFTIKDAQKWSQKKFKGTRLFIGLDAAVVVGNPDVITTALIIIPLTIALALVLPGNRVLPFADLAVVPFRVAMVVALTRGNLLKNIIIGLVVTASLLWCGSATAPMLTAIAKSVGINLGTSSMLISSFAATSMIQSYLVFIAFAYKPIIGIPVLLLAFAGAWYYFDGIKKVNHEMDEPLKAQ